MTKKSLIKEMTMKIYAIYEQEYDNDLNIWWVINEDYVYKDESKAKNKLVELLQASPKGYRLEELEVK